jgi:hypothetical protein
VFAPNAALHFAPPLQSLSFTHGTQRLPVQTPLLQSALVAQGALLLRRQKEDWQLPLAHSRGDEQIAPPGALQVGAAHAFDLH